MDRSGPSSSRAGSDWGINVTRSVFPATRVVSWESLAFQPYFTATASNVGYGWWSHDIGGHMQGIEDGELYARWVQFGVFSPILRLHSTNNPYQDRRPWLQDAATFSASCVTRCNCGIN